MATGVYYSSTTTGGSVTNSEGTWANWIIEGTSSSSTLNGTVWIRWTGGTYSVDGVITEPPLRTDDEARQAYEAAAAQSQIIGTERARKQQEAEHKADELLLSLINPRQRKEYKETGDITIYRGRKPKYRLTKRPSYNITEFDDCGHPIQEHCVQTPTPLGDQLATQYLYLHTNPAELLAVANHRPSQG